MTTDDKTLTEQIARALDEVRDDLCGFDAEEMAAAVLPIIREAQAEALRDAAEDLFYDGDLDAPTRHHTRLYDRADQIEKEWNHD